MVARLNNALLRAIDTTKSKFEASTNIININKTNVEVLTEKVNENEINLRNKYEPYVAKGFVDQMLKLDTSNLPPDLDNAN